jgi:3-hydroxyacyl-[acyl-carrier-protein] dehydratase
VTFETHRVIPADHPSLAGHFPGSPIVPGVVVLEEVAAALGEWREEFQLTGIPSVKFVAPIKPGQSFVVGLNPTNGTENQIDFCCRLDGRVVVEGRLEISCGARI